MVRNILSLVIFIIFLLPLNAFSGFFPISEGTSNRSNSEQLSNKREEIPILDSQDKLILKRREEAQKLIFEGRKLIKKGEKKNQQDLITRGEIKKEIGEKQLKLLQEQKENKEKVEEDDLW